MANDGGLEDLKELVMIERFDDFTSVVDREVSR